MSPTFAWLGSSGKYPQWGNLRMCQTRVADSGERMKAGPGKSSFCCRAHAHRLNEKHTCGKLGAALKQNWILGLCQPTAAEPVGETRSHVFTFTLMNMVSTSSDRKSCFQIPEISQMVAGLPLIVFSLAAAELSRVWERGLLLHCSFLTSCIPTACIGHVKDKSVFCLPGKKRPL